MARPPRRKQPGAYGLGVLWEKTKGLPKLSLVGVWFQLYLQASRGVMAAPLTSMLTVATTTVALMLFGGFVLFLENAQNVLSLQKEAFRVSAYLRDSASPAAIQALRAEIEHNEDVASVELRTKEQAFAEFGKSLGQYTSLLDGLEAQSPLPASLEVKFKGVEGADNIVKEFKLKMEQRPEVEAVHYSEGMLSQVVVFMRIFRSSALFAIVFMFLMTAFIIANTIKLAIYTYREEVQIMKLLGASDWYVRAPFVIEGCLQGVIGAGLSLLLIYGVYRAIYGVVVDSKLLSFFVPHFHFLSLTSMLVVIVTGIVVGTVGSLFALRRNTPDTAG